ncbi:hypothetical protein WJX72_010195 [[Myrmecia] bisecta]|uniref:Mur ligase central domain-containing protein n=1 Tax=[Myrmecia] bisecta TaxID=41462 RepID=A0AAW1R8T7_9CHLO
MLANATKPNFCRLLSRNLLCSQHILRRAYSTSEGERLLNSFTNHESSGIPKGAGTDGPAGFELGRMHRLLDILHSPQHAWPVVHLAGSKGKGSTATMLAAILQQSGYRVGLYTSPHVMSLRERICIDSMPVSEADFDALVLSHKDILQRAAEQEQGQLSHFEVVTALAFEHFQNAQIDIAVVEAGLGGVRDATNVFSNANLKLAIITAIGREHEQALGGTIPAITGAKAGIMKAGRPVALDIIWKKAEQGGPQRVHMRLIGSHQAANAATAVAAALHLRQDGMDKISCGPPGAGSVVAGLQQAFLQGRFQVCRLQVGDDAEEPGPWVVLDASRGQHLQATSLATGKQLGCVGDQSCVRAS